MSITTRQVEAVTVIEAAGELDLHTSPALDRALQTAIAEGAARVVVNLLSVEYLDSTALAVLAAVRSRVAAEGGAIAVAFNNPQIERIFAATGLDDVFAIFASERDAVAALMGERDEGIR